MADLIARMKGKFVQFTHTITRKDEDAEVHAKVRFRVEGEPGSLDHGWQGTIVEIESDDGVLPLTDAEEESLIRAALEAS